MELSGGLLVLAAILSGIVHAFDVDHLVTVATFSSTRAGWKNSIRFCAHWAVGHGATILALAILVYFMGIQLPQGFFEAAEALVGVVLVGLGVWLLKSIKHALSDDCDQPSAQLDMKRKPFAIGSLHGVAGSAPILLAFLVDVRTPLVGLGLILLFVIGVFISMIGVGLVLGSAYQRVSGLGKKSIQVARGVLAGLSILVGGTMVYAYF